MTCGQLHTGTDEHPQPYLSVPHTVIFVLVSFRTHLDSETDVSDSEATVSDSETTVSESETAASESEMAFSESQTAVLEFQMTTGTKMDGYENDGNWNSQVQQLLGGSIARSSM